MRTALYAHATQRFSQLSNIEDLMKTIYLFNSQTRELIGSAVADESPLEPGEFLMPADATDIEPPEFGKKEIAVFIDDEWIIKPDWRGVILYKADGTSYSISAIGDEPDDGSTELPPPDEMHQFVAGQWVLDQAKIDAQLKSAKEQASLKISTLIADIRSMIAGTTDPLEVAGWPEKRRIAEAIAEGKAMDKEYAIFEVEVRRRGIQDESVETFTQKVLRNAGRFSLAAGDLDGLKRNATDAIAAALSVAEVESTVDFHTKKINSQVLEMK